MRSKIISILLDSPSNSYYAGTNVTGRVIVTVDTPLEIRSLVLKLQGRANVSWEESRSERSTDREGQSETRNVNESYTSEEEYFNNKYNLLGETCIPAGENVYPFSSPLPPLLPSSFTGEHGGVKYTVKATIDRAWKFDEEAKLEFSVVAPLDLNVNPVAKAPVKKEAEKFFCCFCCSSGPLSLVLSLPYSGYVPGQTMTLTLEVDNASNVEITSVDCKLRKVVTWISNSPSRNESLASTELLKVSLEGVSPRGSKSWSQQMIIPEMQFTNLEACSVIKMTHLLVVTACVTGCHRNLSLEVPIIIGSVPIYSGIPPSIIPGQMNPGYPSPTIPSGDASNLNGYQQSGVYPSASGYPLNYPPSQPSAPPASPPSESLANPFNDNIPNIGFKIPAPYP